MKSNEDGQDVEIVCWDTLLGAVAGAVARNSWTGLGVMRDVGIYFVVRLCHDSHGGPFSCWLEIDILLSFCCQGLPL